jgi:penicillin-binding protein 1A
LLYAIVCAEDAAFFHHPGLDVLGIARALWVDLWAGRYVQGASTITQQFAKTRYLSREKTLTRKFKELVLARKLEQQLSKQDILAMYANEIYFGNGRYGVEEAARWYFGKPVGQINVAEAALLAALINGPSRLNPFRHAKAARQRRAYVLRQMLRHGYIDEATRNRADAEPLPQKGHPTVQYAVPYYAAEVRRRALKRFGKNTLLHGGLRIDIGLDVTVQQAAETAVAEGLRRVDHKYRVTRPLRHYRSQAALKAGLARLARRQSRYITKAGRVLLAVVRGYDMDRKSWLLDLGSATGHLPQSHLRRYRSETKAAKAR